MKKVLVIFFISLFASNSSYSEPVTVKNTKWHHMDIKKHFEIITDNVRSGKTAQKFEIRHGECKKQDCKWGARAPHLQSCFLHSPCLISNFCAVLPERTLSVIISKCFLISIWCHFVFLTVTGSE